MDQPDPLTVALLPVLMHRLNNATQVLHGLKAVLALRESTPFTERRGADLAYASRSIDEVGWMLGVLASASGADLLLARRDRRGLAPVVATVHEALQREDRELGPCNVPLPDLDPGVADGWQLPWGIGAWLYSSALLLPERTPLEWRLDRGDAFDELVCRTPENAGREELEKRIAEHLPEARFRRKNGVHALLLSRGSLVWGGTSS